MSSDASTRDEAKAVLVTGGNRGIGLEVCRQLAGQGFRVLLGCRDLAAGQRIAAGLGGSVEARGIDVSEPESIDALASALARELGEGGLAALVNNAAVALDGFDGEVAARTALVNVDGPWRLTDACVPLLGTGTRLVMVSSGIGELSGMPEPRRGEFAALGDGDADRERLRALIDAFVEDVQAGEWRARGWPSSAYRVSKVALNALTRIYHHELGGRGVLVNAVCPGWVRTDMGGSAAPRSPQEGASGVTWVATLAPDGPSGAFFRDQRRIDW